MIGFANEPDDEVSTTLLQMADLSMRLRPRDLPVVNELLNLRVKLERLRISRIGDASWGAPEKGGK